MPDIIVHTIPGSPYARAVLATLEEKQVPWRIAPVMPNQLREPAHLSRNPFGRMPAVEHGDFMLYETQVMNINDWYLFQGCGNVIGFQRVVGPRVLGLTPDEAAIAAAMPHSHRVFRELSRLLGDKPYFAGDHISLAEMMLVPQLDFLAQSPEWSVLTSGLTNLGAWFERTISRPSFQATTWDQVLKAAAAA
jgi:glutathione S-transferase